MANKNLSGFAVWYISTFTFFGNEYLF